MIIHSVDAYSIVYTHSSRPMHSMRTQKEPEEREGARLVRRDMKKTDYCDTLIFEAIDRYLLSYRS